MQQNAIRLLVAVALLAFPAIAGAQAGSITGRVTDATTGEPLSAVTVTATLTTGPRAGAMMAPVITDDAGNYRVPNLDVGTYSVRARRIGYQVRELSRVEVAAGLATRADIVLTASAQQLEEVVATGTVRQEKALDSPQSIHSISQQQVEERPAPTVTEHLRDLPGVDVAQGGMMQANTVARGFNNIFSGSLLTLTDNRFAFVPSLRVNVPYFIPETNEDIERIEVVLGPAAALYGPNTAGGVMHIITRSPFGSQGTNATVETGTRGFFRGSLRTSHVLSSWLGFKASYQYFRAEEFPTLPEDLDPAERVPRDTRLERAGGSVRVDVRPAPNTEIVGNFGRSKAMSAVEPTGLGAGQVRNWSYDTYQVRARRNRLFAQVFRNNSDAGETFLLRTLAPIVDSSYQWVGQIQNGNLVGPVEVIYGFDYQHTTPQTGGTINGRNEADDQITEYGGYLHSVFPLSNRFEFLAAARVDRHNRVDENVVSPRAALVYRLAPTQNLRLTYNRAFSQPSTNNLFLDLLAGRIPTTGTMLYGVRALGVPHDAGLTFPTCAGGFGDLCMRVPQAFSVASGGAIPANTLIPAQASSLYRIAIGAAAPALIAAGIPANVVQFMGTLQPTPAQVTTQLRVLNPTAGTFSDVAPTDLRDIPPIKPTITQGFEFGHKALFFNRWQFVWDVWHEQRTNFVGPLIVETPNVFLDRASLNSFLAASLTPVVGGPTAAVIAGNVSASLAGISGSNTVPGVPLGVVNFDHTLSSSSDVILTYRNFGKLNVWGADMATEYLFDNGFSVGGTYSHVSKDFFPRSEIGGVSDISLNAPRDKGSLAVKYRNPTTGLSAELRGRAVRGFPVTSGVWTDVRVDGYHVMDLGMTVREPIGGALLSLYAYNLFNYEHKQFAGGAQIGRLIVAKMSYGF
jgi:outer membrane receptor for ferrienterochelin and colicins